ncbi:hypothetical protein EW145_g2697 [Phellinidium pouzarii]|uniref:Uncharacterized protein n=1 Tax=Phellinidium pouzarii TaxID=167371 RepID=A0A4S4LA46_9AGAM|nr:hypothetical protein EW145_g2697 [Phellinidium pouzarii]
MTEPESCAVPLTVGKARRDVVDPPVTAPNATTVWVVGTTQTVVWDTTNLPSQITNTNGTVLLGFINDTTSGEHLMTDSPLASGFDIRSGSVDVVVPDVEGRTDYIIALLGDSGNISDEFTIENPSGSATSSAGPTSSAVVTSSSSTSTDINTVTPQPSTELAQSSGSASLSITSASSSADLAVSATSTSAKSTIATSAKLGATSAGSSLIASVLSSTGTSSVTASSSTSAGSLRVRVSSHLVQLAVPVMAFWLTV